MVRTGFRVESENIKEYYALQRRIEAERVKPIAKQDYTNISRALSAIADDKETSKAARYARFTLKQIERYELAFEVEKAVRLQDAHLQQVKERIDKARATKLAEVPDLGRYTAVGLFRTSSIYDPQLLRQTYYRVVDSFGNTVCYAVAEGLAAQMDLSKLRGRQVGLIGTIQPHQQTGDALVKFTEIVELSR